MSDTTAYRFYICPGQITKTEFKDFISFLKEFYLDTIEVHSDHLYLYEFETNYIHEIEKYLREKGWDFLCQMESDYDSPEFAYGVRHGENFRGETIECSPSIKYSEVINIIEECSGIRTISDCTRGVDNPSDNIKAYSKACLEKGLMIPVEEYLKMSFKAVVDLFEVSERGFSVEGITEAEAEELLCEIMEE